MSAGRTAAVDGLLAPRRLQARGGGGTVVFVHGTLDDSRSWRRVTERLPDWHRITYDRRGWGQHDSAPATFSTAVDDLADIVQDAGPCGLVGHSYGGTIACAAAARLPRQVQWIVAYEPPLPWLPWWPALAPWEELVLQGPGDEADAAERLLRALLGDDGWERLSPAVRERRRSAGGSLVTEMRSLRDEPPCFDPLELRQPALIAAGTRSLPHHLTVAQRFAELLPSGRYSELDGAGHAGHVEQPAAVADLVGLAASMRPEPAAPPTPTRQ